MKNIFIMLLLILPIFADAQFSSDNGEYLLNEYRKLHLITKFSSDFIGGKVMVSWSVINTDRDCVYQVERSENETNYEIIGSVNGYSTIGNYELFYSYSDKNPLSKHSNYKITIKDVLASSDVLSLIGLK